MSKCFWYALVARAAWRRSRALIFDEYYDEIGLNDQKFELYRVLRRAK